MLPLIAPSISSITESEIPDENGIIEPSTGIEVFIQLTLLAVNVPNLSHLNVDDSLLHLQLFI
ncbi:hypothetical protein [Lysinibacillus irui]|uniref:hypothetical protein n=1 Tax=Lysinibacillus irui TaxID=2998077 RepID=UPI002AD4E706|nr:hypothetical protein [Lysinibacillus irui]MEA0565688.1 hypothetical protein [Lysinibacillus irui]